MKNIFLSLLTIFAVVGTATAQDAPVKRTLAFYFNAMSGDLVEMPDYDKDTDQSRIFNGNEFEFGMTYSQNFATVPWLSMWVKALFSAQSKSAYGMDADNMGDYLGNQSGSYALKNIPRVQLGLNLGGYSIIALDTRGILAQENYYSINLPNNAGKFTFVTILEFWAVPQAVMLKAYDPLTGLTHAKTTGEQNIVDLFAIRVDYSIAFAQNWSFATKFAFRFAGYGNEDSATAFFKDGFNLRWENRINWKVTPSFNMWTQLRYRIENITHRSKDIDHRLMLQAGLGYSFDFSNN